MILAETMTWPDVAFVAVFMTAAVAIALIINR